MNTISPKSSRIFIFLTLLLSLIVVMSGCSSKLSAEEIFKRNKDSVGKIVSNSGSGSAFIIDGEKGLALTNYHVIKRSKDIHYINNENESYDLVGVLFASIDNDIAIIKLNSNNFKSVKIGKSEILNTGENVYVISSPGGTYLNTLSEGIISGLRLIEGKYYYQHSASIEPGSSGGALFDEYGNVIGIVNMGETGMDIDFAIIVDDQIIDIVDKYKNLTNEEIETYMLPDEELSFREGDIINGVYTGIVNEFYPDGTARYIGDMVNNKYDGFGKLVDRENGLAYEGYFKNGVYEGSGNLYELYDGTNLIYTGGFKEGIYSGLGKEFYSYSQLKDEYYYGDQNRFNFIRSFNAGFLDLERITSEGWETIIDYKLILRKYNIDDFENDLLIKHSIPHIRPGLADEGVMKYEGTFENGLLNGHGKYYKSNGELLFEGEFKDGLYHGNGIEYNSNLEVSYEGIWDNGIRIDE